jgi:hypothetical protein
MSCVGVMFAPHHQASADELVRVCRPGGTIGLLSRTPTGFMGQMFAAMKPYVPPPAGTQPPPLWGSEDHVRTLLGDTVAHRRTVRTDQFASPLEFLSYYKANYGPTIAAYREIADDQDRVAALDRDLTDLAARHQREAGSTTIEFEYLLLTARKRG